MVEWLTEDRLGSPKLKWEVIILSGAEASTGGLCYHRH